MFSVTGLRLLGVAVAGSLVLTASLAGAQNSAAPIDYVELVRTKVLPCIHPTVKADKAEIEVQKDSTHSGDTTTTRVQVFYAGLIKKNSMQADILVRESGSIRQFRVNVLSDTSAVHGSCDLTKNWADF
jgi:hypothetical protein